MNHKAFVVVLENDVKDRVNLRFGSNATVSDIMTVMSEEADDLKKKSAAGIVGVKRMGFVEAENRKNVSKMANKLYNGI